jgi:L-methionine (R)-S-oxide reductase
MSQNQLGHLHDLAQFLISEKNLSIDLAQLARHAAQATGAGTCSIMLLTESESEAPRLKLWASTEALPAAAWAETSGRGESIAGRVLERGSALLIADIGQSEFRPLARRHGNLGSSFMCVPIAVADRIIGVMNCCNRPGAQPLDESDLAVAGIVAALIGKSVQVERLQTLLRSRVAQMTLAREAGEVATRLTDGALHPARIAKELAKSFYKDLAAAGFEPGQIIEAASEIITQITSEIGRHKKRMAREHK